MDYEIDYEKMASDGFDNNLRENERLDEEIEMLERQNQKDRILLQETQNPQPKSQIESDIKWRNQKIADKKSKVKANNWFNLFFLLLEAGAVIAGIIAFLCII